MNLFHKFFAPTFAAVALAGGAAFAAESPGVTEFRKEVRPLLENYCFDCHADGANKGNIAFDEFKSDQAAIENHELWLHVLKNLRAGLMPPPKKSQPTQEEKDRIERWIKSAVFAIDPQNPDPGRVTIRRLNRIEYRNTIRDLIGVRFDTESAFPADDTGHGFDSIGDVLTLPPMLLEKYVVAANQIVSQVVPTSAKVVREEIVDGAEFEGAENARPKDNRRRGGFPEPMALSYYKPATVSNTFKAKIAGKYQLGVALMINERYVDGVVDRNQCRLSFRVDGKELLNGEYAWAGGKGLHYSYDVDLTAGDHEFVFELQPLTPDEPQTRSLSMQITSIKVSGPLAQDHWVQPKNYTKFFPKKVPEDVKGRREYARELLGDFARRAFRRPADEKTLDRLVGLAESVYGQSGKTFETGISQGMVAILASPRFLFREERMEPAANGATYPFVDEFSLATRLSYFLWSSMPDEEMLRLAEKGELRKNLTAQVERMLKDDKSEAFVRNFVGQWLRARDIENVPIEARFVLAREEKFDPAAVRNQTRLTELREKGEDRRTPAEQEEFDRLRGQFGRRNRPPLRAEMSGELRVAMRLETEKAFDYVLREDRSLLELLDADYTFLNERLAMHYGIPDVRGNEMRLVKLPANSPRGGILTQGTVLGVTSNPTRTSPVKRGVFVLENILGTPPPPPPPDIPPLEDAVKGLTNRAPSLRETLVAHRENALCASCHNRMDPIGLAFENFNAMGMWRDAEYNEPIDATGQLITGETFKDVRELKRVLINNHYKDFYHTVTEKLLIYALGRGLEHYDVETCDQIVARIEAANGRPSALIAGVVESAAFQKMRTAEHNEPKKPAKPVQQRADARLKP
ncbi:MAG: DUF1592 domain-containing protein [Verrucomicrobiota bacterium]